MDIQDTAIQDTIIVGGREFDTTGRPNFKAAAACGSTFYPLRPRQCYPLLSTLLTSPVDLPQFFLPISLVEGWVRYMNEAPELRYMNEAPEPARGPGPGSRSNSSYKEQPSRRGKAWSPTSVSEIYLWIAIQIYIGLHRETRLEDLGTPPRLKGIFLVTIVK
ncbi:hypothetical protein S40285_09513 [Stachybotrys chlorohalonatus IBT 40285]|uniref:Uncharacterized protein n=1 Tax=Stachybotrys chlorohalonatus (strain IBT 40285) TaxID=1283841 RepID=A0A084QS42_STAC4|nr:hypothetical protein S40285_09513 [Stachybotrys chlorohalonata IBT 40285]